MYKSSSGILFVVGFLSLFFLACASKFSIMPDLCYSRGDLFNLQCYSTSLRHPPCDHAIVQIEEHGLAKHQHLLSNYRKTSRGSKGISRRRIPYIVSEHKPPKPRLIPSNAVNLDNLISIDLSHGSPVLSRPKSGLAETKCALVNARSVRNKTFKCAELIQDGDLDFLFITETWLRGDTSDGPIAVELTPPGYEFLNFPRIGRNGGGIAVVHKSATCVKSACPKTFTSFEWTENTVETKSGKEIFVTIYRPPPSSANRQNFTCFIRDFSELLDSYVLNATPVLFLGDLNIHVNKPLDHEVNQFLELLKTHNLTQLVQQPTHRSGNTLDHVITCEDSAIVSSVRVDADAAVSDHYPVFFNLKLKPDFHQRHTTISYRPLKNFDIESFSRELGTSTVLSESPVLDVDQKFKSFTDAVSSAFESHAPLKEKRVPIREPQPWINSGIFRARAERRKYEKLWRRTGLTVHHQIYTEKKNTVTHLIASARSTHFSEKISDCQGDQKKLFGIVQGLLGSKSKRSVLPIHDDQKQLASDFSEFFTNKIEKLNSKLQSNTTSVPDRFEKLCPFEGGEQLCDFRPATVEEIEKLILEMSSGSCDLDPLPTKLLKDKQVLPLLLPAITDIINSSLKTGLVPDAMKLATIKPLLKKLNLDTNELNNYRPISNLSFISKLLERVVSIRIKEHLERYSLNESFKSAYRTAHSTETALLKVANDILCSIDDSKRYVSLILLDLSAAFDTVNHKILLRRLSDSFGISGCALSWFQSYLSNRFQSVRIGSSKSDPVLLTTGVPQGSVLGPLLFTMYTRPLGSLITSHGVSYHFYADDSQLYLSFPTDESSAAKSMLESCIEDIRSWMSANFLMLNDSKTEFICFSSKKCDSTGPFMDIKVGNDSVAVSSSVKNLGILLDSRMNMKEHISKVSRTCYAYIRSISRIRKHLSQSDTEKLVHAFISSRLDQCNSLLIGLPNTVLEPLVRVQRSAARLIMKVRKFDPITKHIKDLHWLPIPQRIEYKILILTHRCLYGNAPSYLKCLVKWHVPKRNLRSKNSYELAVDFVKSFKCNYQDRSFVHVAPKLWNSLPVNIRSSQSLDVFKNRLKTYLFNIAFN